MKNDYYTNDVEGAEGFERYHNSNDNYDNDRDYDDQHDEDDCEDDCNSSDPACPCGGYKNGGV